MFTNHPSTLKFLDVSKFVHLQSYVIKGSGKLHGQLPSFVVTACVHGLFFFQLRFKFRFLMDNS